MPEIKNKVLTITEISKAEDVPLEVTRTQQFFYWNKLLTMYTNVQAYGDQQIWNRTTVTYDEPQMQFVTRTESGSVSTYEYAPRVNSCQIAEPGTDYSRRFVFFYSEDGYLQGLNEYIDNRLNLELRMEHNDGVLSSITTTYYNLEPAVTTIRHFETGTQANSDRLPFLPLTEEYPFYFHVIPLYAGKMGKALKFLPESSRYEGNANETTYYSYLHDAEGHLSSLTINTVSEGTSYKRTFGYKYN